MDIEVFRVKKTWVEGTKDGDTAGTGEPSWRWQLYDTAEWTGWGVDNSADRETTAEDTVTVSAEDVWYEWNVTNSLKYMFDNNQYYGWLLKWQLADALKRYRLYSSEYTTNTAYRPYLEITYYGSPPSGEFLYKKAITIDYSKIGAQCLSDHTDLTDFPVLIKITGDNDLKDKAHSGHVESSNGYDVIFRGGTDGTTQLKHEIEKYDGSAGDLVAWVKVPTIKHDENTTIYMYYGNASLTSAPPATLAQGVWDDNFLAVWHLKEDPTGAAPQMKNSKSSSYHGTYYGNDASGDQVSEANSINGFLDMDGDPGGTGDKDRIQVGSIVGDRSAFTVSLWFKTTSTSLTKLWGESTSGSDYPVMYLSVNENTTGDVEFAMNHDGGGTHWGYVTYTPGTGLNDGNWHHLVGVQTNKSSRQFFVDGAPHGTATADGTNDSTDTATVGTFTSATGNLGAIDRNPGGSPGPMFFLDGGLDEVRISSSARGTCWVQTEYKNKTTSGFYTVYGETSSSPTAVILSSFEASAYDEGVLLEWRTGFEANNLGFNIYCQEGGQFIQINPGLIKGSALMTGTNNRTAGYSYSWWDTDSGQLPALSGQQNGSQRTAVGGRRSAVRYWLEDVDLSGAKTMHGPITPIFSHKPASKKAQSMLLSQINKQQSAVRGPRSAVISRPQAQRSDVSRPRSPVLGPRANVSVSSVDDRNENPAGRMISAPLSDKPLKQSSEVQWSLAGSQAVKIYIQEEGWYRVTQPELVAAGLDPAVNSRFLQLFVDGQEQPIIVKGGKNDRLGSRDSIEFYGTGLDTPYTDTRVYWLVAGLKPGKRIESHTFRLALRGMQDSPEPYVAQGAIRNSFESFPYTVEKKDRTIYVAALKNGDASNFFGAVVSSGPVNQVLRASHLDSFPAGDAALEVSLQGISAGAHEVMVMVNGSVVGTTAFADQALKAERFPLIQAGLVEGENTVILAAQGVSLDVSLVDSIRLTYWRTYTAEEDILKFTSVGGNNLSVNGFSSSSIRVVDITDLQNLKEVGGAVHREGGGYAIRFQVPGNGQRTLLAFVDEEARTPAALELNQPSRWHRANQSADLVIISHGLFLERLEPLKAFRESQGLSVALIDVEDLYDEFSFGIKTPQALKDFLLHAKTYWQKPPRFVLLVGDASFDPRNYYGFGSFDYVPTKLVDTKYIETASDDWFVDFNNDGLPQMAIGRIPVRTEEEAAGVVSKLIGYEQSRERMQDVLLVADMKDKDFDYMAASQGVRALLPGGLMVSEVYRDQFSDDVQVKNELVRGLTQGPLLVNYVGHGTLEFWRGDIFGSDDAEALTNGLRLPLVIGMTCLIGFFQDVYYETLAEAFLKARDGGAVAVWTSSGLTEPDKQAVMNKAMIRLLFNGEGLTIGEAAMRAKKAVNDMDIRRTWILFGDPATKLK